MSVVEARPHSVTRMLDNGLRVVVTQDRSAPVVGVVLSYAVGFRDETPGRSGFAHLFEHLMSQGSRRLDKLEHKRHVQRVGGFTFATTRADHTTYVNVVPSAALEMTLFLEADRMAALRLTQDNLGNQVSVVEQEIRENVLNVPYGGFPWFQLPPLMFTRWANTHDGYGRFEDIEAATLGGVEVFHGRFYHPGNAVLSVAGDADPYDVFMLADRHFATLPTGVVPERPELSEPFLLSDARAKVSDPRAPHPALGIGYRVPNPADDIDAYLRLEVVRALLADGPSSLLHRCLVRGGRASAISGWLGTFGEHLGTRDPAMLQLAVYHEPGEADAILAIIDETMAAPIDPPEVARAANRARARLLRASDDRGRAATFAAWLQLLHGGQRSLTEIVGVLEQTDAGMVAELMRAWLVHAPKAIVEIA